MLGAPEDIRPRKRKSLSGLRRESLKKLNRPIIRKTEGQKPGDKVVLEREKDKEEKDKGMKKSFRSSSTKPTGKLMRIDKNSPEKDRKEKKWDGMFSFAKRTRKSAPGTTKKTPRALSTNQFRPPRMNKEPEHKESVKIEQSQSDDPLVVQVQTESEDVQSSLDPCTEPVFTEDSSHTTL